MKRLIVAALVIAALGTWFLVESRSTPTGANAALLDTGATTEVSGQVSEALERIFSYSYDNVDATDRAARDLLTGGAIDDYEELFAQVRAKAPGQKLVLATSVTVAGVRTLDGDIAHLLVFLDQAATRIDTAKSSGSAAVLSVTAKRMDGVWKITELIAR